MKQIESVKDEEIIEFVREVKEIYINWVDAKWDLAINKLEELLRDKNLLSFELFTSEEDLYFRGRQEEGILTKDDMFHIPFNRRYLIQNQRYSLTGQPLVYLGSSVLDITEELSIKRCDRLKISSVIINKKKRVYDFRNNIWNDLKRYVKSNISASGFLDGEKTNSTFSYDKSHLFKLIFAQLCSFPKKKDSSFCEEYVIPQLFAHLLKREGFEGIYYYSTKEFADIEYGENLSVEQIEKLYFMRENIALFTNFVPAQVYDNELRKDLDISSPVNITQIAKIKAVDVARILGEISLTNNMKKQNVANHLVAKYCDNYDNTKLKRTDCLEYEGTKLKNIDYVETEMGLLQMYLLYSKLNTILVDEY